MMDGSAAKVFLQCEMLTSFKPFIHEHHELESSVTDILFFEFSLAVTGIQLILLYSNALFFSSNKSTSVH